MINLIEKAFTNLQKVNIVHIILISFAAHIFLISYPNVEGLDEIIFTNLMRWLMVSIDQTPYQLPGIQLIIAPFVLLFGDNHIAWRLPIIIFGIIFLYFYFKVIEHVTNKRIALLSTVILSLAPLIFVHSSFMFRDIPVMALGFMSIYLYFKQRYYFSALLIGLSALIKETAIFFMAFIIIWSIIKFVQHNDINRGFITYIFLNHRSRSPIKKSVIFVSVVLSVFLISLFIYDNTVTVLEYETKFPEYTLIGKDGKEIVKRFEVQNTNSNVLTLSLERFNYVDVVKDPIHHLNLIFTKGYYSDNVRPSTEFLASFLPIPSNSEPVDYNGKSRQLTMPRATSGVLHITDFEISWKQGMINYTFWHISFWGILGLITYTIYCKVKKKEPVSNTSLFIILGLVFFVPYLVINMMRDTFSYYMIYYIPFMAVGLILMIYKIPNKIIRTVVLSSFLLAIFINFLYFFPVKF